MADANGSTAPKPKPAAARLRELLLDKDKLIVCPGVFDGLTARIALQEGFDCLYMTGAGTAASRLGMPDLGVATMNDMLEHASMIASLDRSVPVIADADTGYGGPLMVGRTVRSYIMAGVAGLHLEDQVVTKRCGHLANKELVDEEVYYSRIRAAVMAREEMRQSTGGDIVLIARTDALQSFGYEEAVKRLKRCIELGADVAFLEGPTSVEQCQNACAELAPTPVLLNMVPGGVTPDMSVAEAKKVGYRIIIYPGLALAAVYESVSRAYSGLKKKGVAELSDQQRKGGVKGIFTVCGLNECMEFDRKAGGKAYDLGV